MLTYCRVCCAFESACALPSGVIRGFETTSMNNNGRLVKSRCTDDFVKSSKFKARALTATRRAGGLDFRAVARKTKARPCLQRYV